METFLGRSAAPAVVILAMVLVVLVPAAPVAAEPGPFMPGGEPFFPIQTWGGTYPCNCSSSCWSVPGCDVWNHIQEMSEAGFNVLDWWLSSSTTVADEVARLNTAKAAGMKVRYMIYAWVWDWPAKEQTLTTIVNGIKDHEALFGYWTQDEPEWQCVNHPSWDPQRWAPHHLLKDMAAAVHAEDPDHPVVLNYADISLTEGQNKCCAPCYPDPNASPPITCEAEPITDDACTTSLLADWMDVGHAYTMDVYPRGRPFNVLTQTWIKLRDEIVNNPNVPTGYLIIGTDAYEGLYGTSTGQPADLDEVRFMAFDGVAAGSKSIEFYGCNRQPSPSDAMWTYVKTVAKELSVLQDVLAGGITISASNYTVPSTLNAICKQYPLTCVGKRYLIVTNPADTARNNQQLTVPAWTGSIEKQASGGGWTIIGSGTSITANFVAWDAHVYRADVDGSPGQATDPNPTNGLAMQVVASELAWIPDTDAESQKLYLSDNQSDVSSRALGALKLTDPTGTQASYSPLGLQKGMSYYWCVDTLVFDEHCCTQGEIWSFIVAHKGDFDLDLDVDQEDFGHFQACLTGSGITQTNPNCRDADLDLDGDVDAADFDIFLGCMGGPNLPPGC